jgi:lipopolysaccharide biosynthesis protein
MKMRLGSALLLGELRRTAVRSSHLGADPNSGSSLYAIYVHYDPDGIVHDFVVRQLQELVNVGFRIIFVTNSPKNLEKDSTFIVAQLCFRLIWRYNVGYDFGGYKDGIEAIRNLDTVAQLLLMNDSVYGPFWPLSQALNHADPERCDFWGITDSWAHCYHIQSYFMLFFPKALRDESFLSFWKELKYYNHKHWIISKGEMKLTQILLKRKLRAQVLCPFWEVVALAHYKLNDPPSAHAESNKIDPPGSDLLRSLKNTIIVDQTSFLDLTGINTLINPSHQFWDILISEFKCPFLKRELIKFNPAKIPSAWQWDKVIARDTDYPVDLIWQHLRFN